MRRKNGKNIYEVSSDATGGTEEKTDSEKIERYDVKNSWGCLACQFNW